MESVSLTYAKRNYKNKYSKYGESASFEDSILKYYLGKEEITSLYEYATKITKVYSSYTEQRMLNNKYQEYLEK